jgi:hypothetical protein
VLLQQAELLVQEVPPSLLEHPFQGLLVQSLGLGVEQAEAELVLLVQEQQTPRPLEQLSC